MNDNGRDGLLVDEQEDDDDGEQNNMVDGDDQTGDDEIEMFSAADEYVIPLTDEIHTESLSRLAGDFGEVEQGEQFIPMDLPFIGRPPRGTRPPGFGASRLFLNGPIRGLYHGA